MKVYLLITDACFNGERLERPSISVYSTMERAILGLEKQKEVEIRECAYDISEWETVADYSQEWLIQDNNFDSWIEITVEEHEVNE